MKPYMTCRFLGSRLAVIFLVFSINLLSALDEEEAAQSSSANLSIKDVAIQTSDEITVKATLGIPDSTKKKTPAVILIHQAGSGRHEWDEFFQKLLNKGYTAIAYDIRGHGESDNVENIYQLFDNPDLAPNDLKAVIRFLKSHKNIDSKRIAVVGASIGANLACVSSAEMKIKTAVFISGKTTAVFDLAGKKKLKMKSVYYISSEGDQDGKRAQWAKELYEMTSEPKILEIVKHSNAHGVSIFRDSPAVQNRIIKWLQNTL
jgi:dienelactone hydrolase